jgi:hypothetical protein
LAYSSTNNTAKTLYRVALCTSNLGATQNNPGHPNLKHCYAKIIDDSGKLIDSLSFGLHGVGRESHPDNDSSSCKVMSQPLNHQQLQRFITAFNHQGQQPYRWGHNDCCSLLAHAISVGAQQSVPLDIALAQNRIKRSRDLSNPSSGYAQFQ